MAKMDIKDYVRALREEFFEGDGSAIYLNHRDELLEFFEDAPYEVFNFGAPNISEVVFPIAIIYDENRAFWVDSSGALWSCGPKFCTYIKDRSWLPS